LDWAFFLHNFQIEIQGFFPGQGGFASAIVLQIKGFSLS
jgi:hypothetical protein